VVTKEKGELYGVLIRRWKAAGLNELVIPEDVIMIRNFLLHAHHV
jgi:hypothetical protein